MKIYSIFPTQELSDTFTKALSESGQKDITAVIGTTLSAKEVIEKAKNAEILIAGAAGVEFISEELLKGLSQLKFITTIGVSTDWVDKKSARKRGIIVSNQKGVNAESVAEHCWGLILDIAKRITESDRGIREKGEYRYSPYTGYEVYKKTIGVIGLGDIGQRVARIAKGFDMHILGTNKSRKDVKGIEVVGLEKLLEESDVIVVTLPLTPETDNLLSDKEFVLMKEGVILVTTSRETIINKKAVLKALETNKVFGYGMETEIMQPLEKNDPYLNHPRIVLTPHIAAVTKEANDGYVAMTVENIQAFLKGKPIRVVTNNG